MADIELYIRRLADASLVAELYANLPDGRAPLGSATINIDSTWLLSLSTDLDVYGKSLTSMAIPAALHPAWQRARGFAEATGQGLHLRVVIGDPSDALHALRWELLRDPLTSAALAQREGGSLARLVVVEELHDALPPTRPALHALVAIAGPRDYENWSLAPVDVPAEAARALGALGDIKATLLAEAPSLATLANITTGLRGGAQLLYLVCHGKATEQGSTTLFLVGEDGNAAPISGDALEAAIKGLEPRRRPLLAVLLACESASQESAPLASVGPLLARAGVPAVLAMQAPISMAAAAKLTTRFLGELARDGRIAPALAAARKELGDEWWVPALWLRGERLWAEAQATHSPIYDSNPAFAEQGLFVGRDALLAQIRESLTARPAARVALVGLPGGGKSRLARALFHDPALRDHFQGGILCAALGENPSLELEIARWFGEVFRGVDAQQLTIEKQAEWLRQHIAADAQPWLCILDDLWAVQDLATFQELIAAPALLITTRQQDAIDELGDTIRPQEEIFPIGKLKRVASVELLRQRAGITTTEYDAEFADLAALAGDLPLSLTIVGGFLRSSNKRQDWLQAALQDLAHAGGHESIDQAAQNYGRRRSWWQRLIGIDRVEHALDVDAILQLSYKLLPRDAQRAIIRLAALPPDPLSFDDQAASVVIEAQGEDLRDSLLALTERSLVQMLASEDRLQLHQRIWEWARRQSPRELEEAKARWRSWRLDNAPNVVGERTAWMRNRRNAELLLQAWRETCGEAATSEAERWRNFDASDLKAALFTAIPTLIQFYYGSTIATSLERVARFFEWRDDRQAAGVAHLYCGEIAHQQARTDAARRHGDHALILFQAAGDEQGQAAALDLLGRVAQSEGHYDEAEPLLREALAIVEHIFGVDTPNTAANLNNLALLLSSVGDYAAARPLYERALAIRETSFGPTHPDTAQGLNNLAGLLESVGDYAAARPLYERALAIRETSFGPTHPDTAISLNNLAGLLESVGDYAAARPLYERALTINEASLGPTHPHTAISLNNLAGLLESVGDYAAARPLSERALAIREQVLGPDHPDTAQSLNNLALLLEATGDYAAARPLSERALAIREQVLGPDHPDTAQSLNNLALLLEATGDYAAARPLSERALAIREQVLGPDHPDTAQSLNNLALLLEATGDYAAARPLSERALAIREQVLGPDHPDTAQSLNNLAGLLRATGDYAAARPLSERALAIREQVLGPDHPDTAQSLNNLAGLLRATGDYAAARPLSERALAIREQVLGPDHPDTAQSLNNLALLLEAIGDYAAARPLSERALAIREQVLGPDHPDTQRSRQSLVRIEQIIAGSEAPPSAEP